MKKRDYVVFMIMGLYLLFLPLFLEMKISKSQTTEVTRELEPIAIPYLKDGYPICMDEFPYLVKQKENRKWVVLNVNGI